MGFNMRRSKEVERMVELAVPYYNRQKLIDALQGFTDAEVIHGLGIFLGKELNKKGYGWQYAAGVVQKEAEVIRRESLQLPPLPKNRNL